jgi:hypothetical protein
VHNGGGRSNGGGGASDRRKKMTLGWAGTEWPGGLNATWAGAERKQRKNRDGPQGQLGRNGFGLR